MHRLCTLLGETGVNKTDKVTLSYGETGNKQVNKKFKIHDWCCEGKMIEYLEQDRYFILMIGGCLPEEAAIELKPEWLARRLS